MQAPGTIRSRGRRAALAIGAIVAAVALAACGPEVDGDPELTIYLSAPLSGPVAADGRDLADGARLALEQEGGEAAGTEVSLEILDDADAEGWDPAQTGENARAATRDSTAIAYLGELDSGATRTSLPITNQAGLLQVSAGSGAVDLTRDSLGSSRIPTSTQPSGAQTFGRVIPSDFDQGRAAAALLSSLGVGEVSVAGGREPFGAALLAGLESAATAPAQVADAEDVLIAREDLIGSEDPSLPGDARGAIVGSDALLDRDDLGALRIFTEACATGAVRGDCPDGAPRIQLTSATLDPAQLPAAAGPFLDDFERSYGRDPGRYAAYGFEAMAVILDAIERAEDPLDRVSVTDAFFATTDRDSILGSYSIDQVGDTTLESLGAFEVRDGRAVPLAAPLTLP